MKKEVITIHTNNSDESLKVKGILTRKLETRGYLVSGKLEPDSALIVCIGGDGAFLEGVHKFEFPCVPFIGINTGHLGFFQEISPTQLDDFIFNFEKGKYTLQELSTVKAEIRCGDGQRYTQMGLNELVIRGELEKSVHLDISIGNSFIEKFSGDGILVATPAGSTAYNYSLGGSIVDPRIKLLQLTPIAPMNTIAYRSLTSSILLPAELSIGITPDNMKKDQVKIISDYFATSYEDVEEVVIGFSSRIVKLLRFESYDFWNKVKSKFL